MTNDAKARRNKVIRAINEKVAEIKATPLQTSTIMD
jgi:hypothetical protein